MLDFLVRRIEAAVADVLAHRRREEHCLLRHDANLAAQRRDGDIADVKAVDGNAARRDLVEARDQVGDRRLAGAARPDKGDHLAGFHFEADVGECRHALLVLERDVVEDDVPLDLRQFLGVRLVRDRLLEVDDGEDAVDGGHRALQVAVDAREALDRVCEVDSVRQEGDECTGRHLAVDDLVAAEPDDDRDRDGREELDGRRQEARELNVLHRRLEVELILAAEALDLVVLAHERLDDADGRDALLQERGDVGHALLDDRAVALDLAPEDLHGLADERDDDECQDGELPVEHDHHDERADEDGSLRDHLDELVDESRLDGRHIVRDVAHDLACLMAVEVGHRHALELAEHDLAHIDDDLLADERDEVRLPVEEDAAQEEDDDDADADDVEHHHVLLGQHLIDHVLDDPGQVEVGRRRHDDAEDSQYELLDIWPHVLEQPLVILHVILLNVVCRVLPRVSSPPRGPQRPEGRDACRPRSALRMSSPWRSRRGRGARARGRCGAAPPRPAGAPAGSSRRAGCSAA